MEEWPEWSLNFKTVLLYSLAGFELVILLPHPPSAAITALARTSYNCGGGRRWAQLLSLSNKDEQRQFLNTGCSQPRPSGKEALVFTHLVTTGANSMPEKE